MGDSIFLNILSLVDKRLNRFKGLPSITKQQIQSNIEQYQKTREILNNAKKLLIKDTVLSADELNNNIQQVDIRLTLATIEESALLKRLGDSDFKDDDFIPSSPTIPTLTSPSKLLIPTLSMPITNNNSKNDNISSTDTDTTAASTSASTSISSTTSSSLSSTPSQTLQPPTLTSASANIPISPRKKNAPTPASTSAQAQAPSPAPAPASTPAKAPTPSTAFTATTATSSPIPISPNKSMDINKQNSDNSSHSFGTPVRKQSNSPQIIALPTDATYNSDNPEYVPVSKRGEQITKMLQQQHYQNETIIIPRKQSKSNKRFSRKVSNASNNSNNNNSSNSTIQINSSSYSSSNIEIINNKERSHSIDKSTKSTTTQENEISTKESEDSSNNTDNNIDSTNLNNSNKSDSDSGNNVDILTNNNTDKEEVLENENKQVEIGSSVDSNNSNNSNNSIAENNIIEGEVEIKDKELTFILDDNLSIIEEEVDQVENKQQVSEKKIDEIQQQPQQHSSTTLGNSVLSSSIADAFILKQMMNRSGGSELTISQIIQPFISADHIIPSSLPSNILVYENAHQKISQKLKMAKSIPVRKTSEARIGHARTNSIINLQRSNGHQPSSSLSQSLPNSYIDNSSINKSYISNSNSHIYQQNNSFINGSSGSSTSLSSSSSTSSAHSTPSHDGVNNNNNNNNNNTTGQGERLALLQSLLKSEELTNNADRKVMDEINKVTRQKSEELYQLVWEVRNLDKAITTVLSNQLPLSDISMTRYPEENNNSNVNGSSTVTELSIQLKHSLERLLILMRTEPAILTETLYRAGYLREDSEKQSHHNLSQAIVFSLFGNCFTATDERLLLNLIRKIAEFEFSKFQDKRKFGTQEPFSFTLLSTYLKCTFGKPYLISVLKDLIVSIIQDHNMNLENDPQKKAMLAEIGLDEEPQVDQNLLLQQFSGEFLQRVIALSTGLPYGLRWSSKFIINMYREHLKQTRPADFIESDFSRIKDSAIERELMIHLVFENFFIPALLRPDHYGVLPGLNISQKTRHNLIQIAKMVLTFLSSPSSIPTWLNESMNLDARINEYFNEISMVEEPESYYNRPVYELELGQNLLVSSTDLFQILELIYHNKPESPDVSETASLQLEMVEMIKEVQPASHLQDGMKFLVINVIPRQKEGNENRYSQQIGQSVRLAKENLIRALCVLNFLCGYSSTSICELLLLQCGRSRSLELNILEAQIEETIRSLWALPDHYKKNDYQQLIDSMLEDYNKREKKRNMERQIKMLYLDQLQRHTSQIISQKNINLEFLTNQKFRHFRDKTYARMQTEFVSEFMSRFSIDTGYCSCSPNIDDNNSNICGTCSLKSTMIGTFLKRSKDAMEKSDWWKGSDDEELDIALHTIERNLMTQIYNYTFSVSKEDVKFTKQLKSKSAIIDHRSLYIPEKYANQAPWELAQQEIRKINLYKSPYDKLKCIIDTWNIIFNYTKPLGESGPDDFLPIMGFVIVKARPENLLSNIQYISLYSLNIDPTAEVWFMNLKSSIEVVKEIMNDALNYQGWTKGILQPTTDRMDAMKKELKKKQKSKKYRASIIRLETSTSSL